MASTSSDEEGTTSAQTTQNRVRCNRRNEEPNRYGSSDPLFLHSSDHSALILVAELLDETNYITWSRSMMIALDTRDKLGFINGEVKAPDLDDPSFNQWRKVNSMLISWILNSMSKKIARGFMFSTNALSLWNDLRERFGESNGPMLNQLKRDLVNIKQGSNSVAAYFTELKGLWDEYACFRPRKFCDCCGCGVVKSIIEQDEEDKLHQFVIGLNSEYASVCNQILVMDPLPSVSRAYSMIAKFEKQNSVHDGHQEVQRNSALAVKNFKPVRGTLPHQQETYDRPAASGRDGVAKRQVKRPDLKCNYCGALGHLKVTCFKLHGYPDWWEGSRDPAVRNKFLRTQVAHNVQQDSPLDTSEQNLLEVVANLQLQMERLIKGKAKVDGSNSTSTPESTCFANYYDFAGPQD